MPLCLCSLGELLLSWLPDSWLGRRQEDPPTPSCDPGSEHHCSSSGVPEDPPTPSGDPDAEHHCSSSGVPEDPPTPSCDPDAEHHCSSSGNPPPPFSADDSASDLTANPNSDDGPLSPPAMPFTWSEIQVPNYPAYYGGTFFLTPYPR